MQHLKLTAVLLTLAATHTLRAEELVVLAAASTTDVMTACGSAFTRKSGVKVRFSFASSGTLVRQISSGAPADLFLSANIQWMDFLDDRGWIERASRRTVVGNRMVLVTSIKNNFSEIAVTELAAAPLFQGKIAAGSMDSVPCGIYAKQILTHYQWMDAVRARLVFAGDVRQVLFFVERNEVDAGFVYATDARLSARVRVLTVFPQESHDPILYPAAICTSAPAREAAGAFLKFLTESEAQKIFDEFGFATNTAELVSAPQRL